MRMNSKAFYLFNTLQYIDRILLTIFLLQSRLTIAKLQPAHCVGLQDRPIMDRVVCWQIARISAHFALTVPTSEARCTCKAGFLPQNRLLAFQELWQMACKLLWLIAEKVRHAPVRTTAWPQQHTRSLLGAATTPKKFRNLFHV